GAGPFIADRGVGVDAAHSAQAPAFTIRPVAAAGREIAALTFDLAHSVVLTRQGNPKWAGQEHEGLDPIRANGLFFGGPGPHAEPDFVDLHKVAFPRQTSRCASLQPHCVSDQGYRAAVKWYFPEDAKAVLVMAV